MSHNIVMLAREDNKVFMNCFPRSDGDKWCFTNKPPWKYTVNLTGVIMTTRQYDLYFAKRGPEGSWIWSASIKETDLLTYEIALALFDTIPALS